MENARIPVNITKQDTWQVREKLNQWIRKIQIKGIDILLPKLPNF